MTRESWPPLLRGLGTTLILTAALVAFVTSHNHTARQQALKISALPQANATVISEMSEDSALEEAFENPWFECLSFLGTALIASSFFTEAYVRNVKAIATGAPTQVT